MIFLYIFGALAVLILILLMLRIRITFVYEKPKSSPGNGAVYAGAGPVKIKLYPKKQKNLRLSDFSPGKYRKMLMKDKKAKEGKKKTSDRGTDRKKGIPPGGAGEIFELIINFLEKLTGHLRCEIIKIRLNVGAEDAAATALLYSGVCSAVGFLLETIDTHAEMKLRSPEDVYVKADFDEGEIWGDVGAEFSVRVIKILHTGIGFIINYFKTMTRLENKNSN